jgi:hypothetical protein
MFERENYHETLNSFWESAAEIQRLKMQRQGTSANAVA